jgi:hypothetical protein
MQAEDSNTLNATMEKWFKDLDVDKSGIFRTLLLRLDCNFALNPGYFI